MGGIDLVEGRFDDFLHRVGDVAESSYSELGDSCFFPGDEYYQPNAPKKKRVVSTQRSTSTNGAPLFATAIPLADDPVLSAVVEDELDEIDDADAEYLVAAQAPPSAKMR